MVTIIILLTILTFGLAGGIILLPFLGGIIIDILGVCLVIKLIKRLFGRSNK